MSAPLPILGRFVLAAVLIASAYVLWTASRFAGDLAARHEQMATFRDVALAEDDAYPTWSRAIRAAIDGTAVHETATRDFWHGRYDALTTRSAAKESAEPASLLIAANAAFRLAQRNAGGRPLSVEQLESVLQAYAGVLKNGGFDRDAAWNYEYVARLRDSAAREKVARHAITPSPAPPADTSGLPPGPTIHGQPGKHPPSTKGEEFEVITPMDFGDREAQPEPTPGVKLPRKG
jgi:hypothetical protein